MKLLVTLVILLGSPLVLAQDIYSQGSSPWCLVRDEIETCNYGSAEVCYDIALSAGGYCRENAQRSGLRGDEDWCVVSANGRRCIYLSQEACINAALRIDRDGVASGCVYNVDMALQKSIDRNEAFGLFLEEEVASGGQDNLAKQLREAQAEADARSQEEGASN